MLDSELKANKAKIEAYRAVYEEMLNGLKDPDTTAAHMPPIPGCGADLDSALQALHEHYGYAAR